jgi:phenylacetate-CoA ligase
MTPAHSFLADTKELINKLIPDEELTPCSIDDVVELPSFYGKMKECARLCKSPYSEIDHNVQNAFVLRRLQQMTNTLMLNPLWKERIEGAGLKAAPNSFEEWQQIPLTDKATCSEFYTGSRPGLVVPLKYGGFEIVASGGTSAGRPSETVYSIRELHDTYQIAGDFMGQYMLRDYLAGTNPKWVITTLADYQMWSSGTMVGGVLQNIPGINYIGAGPVRKEVYQHMMSYPGPKAIMGISQSIAYLIELGADMDEKARYSFRAALYGSGLLPTRTQAELKTLYPNLSILSYFAATQAEAIGLQLHHDSLCLATVPGLHLVEIVNEEGRWVAEGEEGELVVTRLHGHEAPLARYKVGDRMIRRPDINGLGLKTQQIEFSGRSGDIIHLCDTQYAAPQVYASLCRELSAAGLFDLDALAYEIQFQNLRKEKTLTLLATMDSAEAMNDRLEGGLGKDGVRKLFKDALIRSLSLFNKAEANPEYLEKSDYSFDITLLKRGSDALLRTEVGKVPLVRDVF